MRQLRHRLQLSRSAPGAGGDCRHLWQYWARDACKSLDYANVMLLAYMTSPTQRHDKGIL